MKKTMMIVLLISLLFTMARPAWATIYTPPGNPVPSKADIAEAERVINGLKWDLTQTSSKGIIILTIPITTNKYGIYINKSSLKDDGVPAADGGNIYDGHGGNKLSMSVSKTLKTSIEMSMFSYETARVLALEQYIYIPGKGIKYIPPKERFYPVFEGDNIIGWVDVEGKPVNPDGSPIITEPKPQVVYPFKDITGHWAVKDIMSLKDTGFINGYPDGTFKPENTITRAEFMVMLGRILAIKYPEAKKNQYESLFIAHEGHWSYKESVKSFGYLESIDITHIFRDDYIPDQPITREEVVAVLNAILKNNKGFQYTPNAYLVLKDTDTSRFPESIVFSSKYNLVNGYPDSTFKPTGNITRAEISAVLVRMLNKLL